MLRTCLGAGDRTSLRVAKVAQCELEFVLPLAWVQRQQAQRVAAAHGDERAARRVEMRPTVQLLRPQSAAAHGHPHTRVGKSHRQSTVAPCVHRVQPSRPTHLLLLPGGFREVEPVGGRPAPWRYSGLERRRRAGTPAVRGVRVGQQRTARGEHHRGPRVAGGMTGRTSGVVGGGARRLRWTCLARSMRGSDTPTTKPLIDISDQPRLAPRRAKLRG